MGCWLKVVVAILTDVKPITTVLVAYEVGVK